MEAGSRGGFLAVSSLWSFCRCKGLYVTLGKTKEERGKMCKSIKYSRTTFLCNSSLFRRKRIQLLFGNRKVSKGKRRGGRLKQGVCLKDRQFVFDKFQFFKNQGPVTQALSSFQSWFVKSPSRRNFCLGGGLCSCLHRALPQGLKWLQREAMIHHSCDSSDSHVD